MFFRSIKSIFLAINGLKYKKVQVKWNYSWLIISLGSYLIQDIHNFSDYHWNQFFFFYPIANKMYFLILPHFGSDTAIIYKVTSNLSNKVVE